MVQQKREKISQKDFANNCIPEYVPDNLPWYKTDSLITYIDKLKYDNFARSRDEYLANTEFVNFEMFYKKINETKVSHEIEKIYIRQSTVLGYNIILKNKKDLVLFSAFRYRKKDVYACKQLSIEHLKKMSDKTVAEDFDLCHHLVNDLRNLVLIKTIALFIMLFAKDLSFRYITKMILLK